MAMSGIEVAEACVDEFINLQKHHHHRYVMFEIQNKNLVVVKDIGCKDGEPCSPQEQFTSFAEKLMATDGGYAVYDAEYMKGGVKQEKVLFILWCPDAGNIKNKMLYTSTKDTVKKKFNGIHVEIQANDADDLKWDTVLEKIERFKR